MAKKELDNSGKWMISFWMVLLFVVIASPMMFKFVNGLVGGLVNIADSDGCPNIYGLILHGVVFGLLVRGMMGISLPGVK